MGQKAPQPPPRRPKRVDNERAVSPRPDPGVSKPKPPPAPPPPPRPPKRQAVENDG